jgi:hypothetical protein
MKRLLFTIVFLFPIFLLAQQALESGKKVKSNQPSAEYDRISINYLLLDLDQGANHDLLKQVFPGIKVIDKFDDNKTSRYLLASPVSRQEADNAFMFYPKTGNTITNKIKDALQAGHYANDVIAKWFSRKEDGSFGVEILQQRGLYNATDYDVKTAGASKLGMAKLMDAGEQLLNKSYILIFEVSDLITKNDDYDRQQKNSKTPVNRLKNGYIGTVNTYLFKIDFNDSVSAVFWQQLWADSGDPALKAKKAAFDNFNFPLTYVYRVSNRVEASQFNPGQALAPKVQASPQDLMLKLINEGANDAMFNIERSLEEFRVKTVLFGTHPLTAKIGLKENLKLDQRFYVYEMQQQGNGEIQAKRLGVIRATKHIVDNRQVSSGQTAPSRFYQVAGKRLDQGMLLQQRNDLGFALFLGASGKGVGGLATKLEYDFSKLLKKAPSMLKFYVGGGYDPASFDMVMNETTLTYENFIHLEAGIGKEFCFMRNLRLQPFAGYGLEEISDSDDSKKTFSSFYGRYGIMLGINLLHNLQFTATWSNYSMNGIITDQDNTQFTIFGYEKWGDAFNRGGPTIDFGLRLEF